MGRLSWLPQIYKEWVGLDIFIPKPPDCWYQNIKALLKKAKQSLDETILNRIFSITCILKEHEMYIKIVGIFG